MRGISFTLRIWYAVKWKDDASDSTHHHLIYCNSLCFICFVFRCVPLALCCCVFLSVLCHYHKRGVQHADGLSDTIHLNVSFPKRVPFGVPTFLFSLARPAASGPHVLVRLKVKEHCSQEQFHCLSFKSVRSSKGH